MEPLLKYFPLIKVDEAAHMVWGLVTSETPDADHEICDYDFAKASIKKWSDEQLAKTSAAGQDPSLGNMRVMHQLTVGGKAFKIEYHDDTKQVWVGSEPANDEVWHLLKGGFLAYHSIGGGYAWKRAEGEHTRYGPTISEISYVDKGSNPDASFAYVKADGNTELRKFAKPGPEEQQILAKLKSAELAKLSDEDVARIAKAVAASITIAAAAAEKGVKYLVPGTTHLPYTDESGKPSHSHMGAAWAALHGGYRGNKYEGEGKEQAIAHLKEIYRQEGMEPPSEKALLDDMRKHLVALGLEGAELDTQLAKFSAHISALMGELGATGATIVKMTAEQLKKAADALGMKPEEYSKLIADTVVGDELAKAKGGLAALHEHLGTAMEHHEAMHKAHTAMGAMHEKMSAHLGKCMKACSAVMGSDGKEADKAIKALVDELKGVTETAEQKKAREDAEEVARKAAAASGTFSKAEVEAMIKTATDAVEKKFGEQVEPLKAGLRLIPRDGEARKSASAGMTDPVPL